MTQGNNLRHIWKVKMTGICELLKVGDTWKIWRDICYRDFQYRSIERFLIFWA